MTQVKSVGISECLVSDDVNVTLTTHALGSCVGVLIYDPVERVGGLLHYMLPDSLMDPVKGQRTPFMFADTGIPQLFHMAYHLGARKERLLVTVLGGSQILASSDLFNIGKRNLLAVRKILWRAGLMAHQEEVGGTAPRTARMEIATGRILVSYGREQHELGRAGYEQRRANGL